MAQVQRFLEVAQESTYGPVYATLLYTGMRRGEALGLRWCDVDLDNATITVSQTLALVDGKRRINPTAKTKAGNRTITIDAGLVDLLRAHKTNRPVPMLDGSDCVFHTREGTALAAVRVLETRVRVPHARGHSHLPAQPHARL